ncbi:hypothetical protein BDW02DRAFT_562565 [Decorospora gaudefroyi]|uniref:Endonuclease/exonuclease/phosphatase domain-containing protein n=1 Tax=Decorospora gaudefroyi TaxID=184978 RepID=A0A6A5JX64_9PLEO|nr:hypothetical protein BDW02DRAFT_562565 [Decorospora gaudefroyi]
MTSLVRSNPLRCSFHRIGKLTIPTITICRQYTNMNRDISPPPAKRHRTSSQTARPPQTLSANPPPVLPRIQANTLRIFSWNVNGIGPFVQMSITSFFQGSKKEGFLHRHEWPAILFLQEVKIAASDVKTQDAVKAAVNARLPSESDADTNGPLYDVHFTLPNDPLNARGLRGSGKIYGMCCIVRRNLASEYDVQVRTVDWDQEGRISVVEATPKSTKSSKLVVFNVYAVNGTDNPYRDSATDAIKATRHDRKLAFHRLLMQKCKTLEEEGWDVLLAGDMNVAPSALDGYPKLRTVPVQHARNRVRWAITCSTTECTAPPNARTPQIAHLKFQPIQPPTIDIFTGIFSVGFVLHYRVY